MSYIQVYVFLLVLILGYLQLLILATHRFYQISKIKKEIWYRLVARIVFLPSALVYPVWLDRYFAFGILMPCKRHPMPCLASMLVCVMAWRWSMQNPLGLYTCIFAIHVIILENAPLARLVLMLSVQISMSKGASHIM